MGKIKKWRAVIGVVLLLLILTNPTLRTAKELMPTEANVRGWFGTDLPATHRIEITDADLHREWNFLLFSVYVVPYTISWKDLGFNGRRSTIYQYRRIALIGVAGNLIHVTDRVVTK